MKIKLPSLVEKTMNVLEQSGYETYVVGGSVRGIMSQQKVKDWDFTTSATPEQIQAVFPESFYENNFGTVGVKVEELDKQLSASSTDLTKEGLSPDDVFEITTYRTEGRYSDNRRPDKVSWGKTVIEDLKRRDFTINAMAIRKPTESDEYELLDPFDGQSDLKSGLIRAVGKPVERFTEDALRMLRAVRIASEAGYLIEKITLKAISENASLMAKVSWERRSDELLKVVVGDFSVDGLKLLLSTNLLEHLLPELIPSVGVEQGGHHTKDVWHHSIDAMANCPSRDAIVRLATLLHDVGKPNAFRRLNNKITFYGHEVVGGRIVKSIGERLHLSKKDQQRLYKLVRYHMFVYEPKMSDAGIRRFIRRVGLENINDMIMLRIGDRVGGGSRQTSWRLREFQERIGKVLYTPMQVKDLKVSGHDVMKVMEVSGGPEVGKVLSVLFEEVMEDSSKNTKKYLMGKLLQLKNEMKSERR